MRHARLIRLAAWSGALAVIAGALGAHDATGKAAEWLRTGGQYQGVHALAAIAASRLARRPIAAWLLLGGSVLFAATLYAMALGGPTWLGAVTPLGGLGMIAGWIMLATGAFARSTDHDAEMR